MGALAGGDCVLAALAGTLAEAAAFLPAVATGDVFAAGLALLVRAGVLLTFRLLAGAVIYLLSSNSARNLKRPAYRATQGRRGL